jgi:hypothetical protein
MYWAVMKAYQRAVAAQELADKMGYNGLEEDLFQISVELQRMAGSVADGRQPRSQRACGGAQSELPHSAA